MNVELIGDMDPVETTVIPISSTQVLVKQGPGPIIPWFTPKQTHHRWQENAFTPEDANASLLRCRMSIAHNDPQKVIFRRTPQIRREYDFEHGCVVYFIFARWTVIE